MENLCLKWHLSKEIKTKAIMVFLPRGLLYLLIYASLVIVAYYVLKLTTSLDLSAKFFKNIFVCGGVFILAPVLRCISVVLFSKSSYHITEFGIQQDKGWSLSWDKIKGYNLTKESSEVNPTVLILHLEDSQVSLPLPDDCSLEPVLDILANKLTMQEGLTGKSLSKRFRKKIIVVRNNK